MTDFDGLIEHNEQEEAQAGSKRHLDLEDGEVAQTEIPRRKQQRVVEPESDTISIHGFAFLQAHYYALLYAEKNIEEAEEDVPADQLGTRIGRQWGNLKKYMIVSMQEVAWSAKYAIESALTDKPQMRERYSSELRRISGVIEKCIKKRLEWAPREQQTQ
jgi:hypothetical protein